MYVLEVLFIHKDVKQDLWSIPLYKRASKPRFLWQLSRLARARLPHHNQRVIVAQLAH